MHKSPNSLSQKNMNFFIFKQHYFFLDILSNNYIFASAFF